MATDQHFCLRWNNHQSTLISVFDTLLESGTLVDCTLAADGQQLKAHKVVLSACSPYLEALLSQHYDKHPIIILRDVKFPELKAMLDYMYRGEVNITQEQLGTFLKAAESLQIKGLTDSGGGGGERDGLPKRHDIRKQVPLPAAITPQSRPHAGLTGLLESQSRKSAPHIPPHVLDIPPSSPLKAREGSVSPVIRKRRKPNQPNQLHNDDAAKLVETPTAVHSPGERAPSTPGNDAAAAANNNSWPNNNKITSESNNTKVVPPENAKASDAAVKSEQLEQLLQPKTEYLDDMNDNENSIDDGQLDDEDDEEGGKMDMSKPGPSQMANTQGYGAWMEDDSSNEDSGAGGNQHNSQGYSQWHVSTDGSADETMINAPPPDSQVGETSYGVLESLLIEDSSAQALENGHGDFAQCTKVYRGRLIAPTEERRYRCACGKAYLHRKSLWTHRTYQCLLNFGRRGFNCPYCPHSTSLKGHLKRHIVKTHLKNVVR